MFQLFKLSFNPRVNGAKRRLDDTAAASHYRIAFEALFVEQCINPELLREILTELSEWYLRQGYVTTRPYLEEQDISDGQVEVQVLVGRIEAIVDADTGQTNRRISTAFAFHDDILNLRELESSLEMMERPSSVTAETWPVLDHGNTIGATKSPQPHAAGGS